MGQNGTRLQAKGLSEQFLREFARKNKLPTMAAAFDEVMSRIAQGRPIDDPQIPGWRWMQCVQTDLRESRLAVWAECTDEYWQTAALGIRLDRPDIVGECVAGFRQIRQRLMQEEMD